MKIIRRLFASATLLSAFVLSANATQVVSYTSTLAPVTVDITNDALAVTPFAAGVGGVPLDALLQSFTVTFNEGIAGNLTVMNTGSSTQLITATLDTEGLLYLFNPTPSGDLVSGSVPPSAPPCDDAYNGIASTTPNPNINGCNGTDPDAAFKKSVTLASGASAGPFSYNATASSVTSSISDPTSLTAVQSAWNVYIDTASNLNINSGAAGNAVYTDQVSGGVTVTYSYIETGAAPEPTTMVLFGSALVGLGLLRKRIRKA
jgi:hypothetical protein